MLEYHISDLYKKAMFKVSVLKGLACRNKGLNQKIMIILYKTIIKPIIEYGFAILRRYKRFLASDFPQTLINCTFKTTVLKISLQTVLAFITWERYSSMITICMILKSILL